MDSEPATVELPCRMCGKLTWMLNPALYSSNPGVPLCSKECKAERKRIIRLLPPSFWDYTSPMLTMILKRVPGVLGIYGLRPIGGVPAGDYFPSSAALLQPDAAAGFLAVEAGTGKKLRVSDIFRSPEASLAAMQKTGVQPPGYSGHNFGFSIDVALDACLASFAMTKQAFDEMMMSYGWYCHRKDHGRGSEDWHYNFFGVGAVAAPWLAACANSVVTSAGVEARMLALYGESFKLDTVTIQTLLQKLKMYGGDLDGMFGPRSQQAVLAFERAWMLPMDGQPDPKMMRTLATVASEQQILP